MNGARANAWVLALALVFLIGPFVVVIASAFGGNDALVFPPTSFSLRWFAKVFETSVFGPAFMTSLVLAAAGTLVALALGVPVAYALVRHDFRGAELVRTVVTAPVVVPGLIVGLALLRVFVFVAGVPVMTGLLIGHATLLVPYAVRVVAASLTNVPRDIEDAAVTLGASRLATFFKVVLPNIRGGLVAAAVLAFITSFDQVPVSLFLTGPGVSTLPVQMLSYMEYTFDPSIAALSALLIAFSVALVLATERLVGLSRYV